MQNNNSLKKLLTVSAVAAMFSAFGVHAQTSGSDQTTSSTTSQGSQNTSGKTTRDGTVDNTNSFGKESRDNARSQGATGSSMGSAQTGSGTADTSGTAGGRNVSGKTTESGTAGNTNSQGMESRSQGKDQSTGSSSGTSGMSGSTGTSGATSSTATGGVAAAGGATASGGGALAKADQKILMDMARANISEIEAGKMAQSKSQNDQVKGFAQQMIDDHSKALTELQQLAQSKGVTLPTEPDAKHKAMASKLEKLSGEAFDKAYMAQAGLKDHKKVHSMLMSDQKRAKDPDVKAAAAKMAPVVEQHLKSAEQMPAVKSGTTSGK